MSYYTPLFSKIYELTEATLVDSQLCEIIDVVKKMDNSEAIEALDEIESTISEIIKLAHKNNITELADIKFERQCAEIRNALGGM